MHSVLVLGAGKIGKLVSCLLAQTKDYQVILADKQELDSRWSFNGIIKLIHCDVSNHQQLKELIVSNEIKTLVSCLPFFYNAELAKLALEMKINYFDPTEDVETAKVISELAVNQSSFFATQCGLAPGFISIVAQSMMNEFDEVNSVRMRVGALPQNISNGLQYGLNWSTAGIVNEYLKPCRVIQAGKRVWASAMEGLEEIKIDGLTYEAFNTSGGVGSLIDSVSSSVKTMDYKTMRYPGHCEKMRFLLDDLKLREKPKLLSEILEQALPQTPEDMVIVYVSVAGYKNKQLIEHHYAKKFYGKTEVDQHWTAIQYTTAASLCVVIDLVVDKQMMNNSVVKQESINLKKDFLSNRFASYYT